MQESRKKRLPLSIRSFVLYMIIGSLWILLSDYIVQLLPYYTALRISEMQTAKGLFFIVATGLILLFYARSEETKARSRETRFRLFAENALDIFFRYRSSERKQFDYISPAVTSMFGYTQEQFYEDPDFLLKVVHSQDRHVLERLLNGTAEQMSELIRWVRKNGDTIWTSVVGQTVAEKDGGGRIVEGIIRDITVLKSAEADLQNAVNQLTAVFRASPLPTYAMSMDGRVLLWNQQAEQVFGYFAEDVVGKPIPLIKDEERDRFLHFHESMVFEREIRHGMEFTVDRQDGTSIELRVSAAPWVDENGETIGSMNVAEDITEQKKAAEEKVEIQEQLYHAQRLESVGRLAGGVAHDINNALSVIQMNAEFLQLAKTDSQELNAGLEEIIQASERASNISRQLLTFSRKQKSRPELVNLTEAVEKLKKMLQRLMGPNTSIVFDLEGDVPVIRIDPTQLEQVVVNLVVNARDAISDRGSIRVCVRNVEDEARRMVLLTVQDDGHGMDLETQRHIFDPYFTTKPEELGTGLGLSTVYGIIEQNHGSIEVHSTLGEGTTFDVYFPVATETEDAHETTSGEEQLHGDELVYIIEDENLLRMSLIRTFNLFGYKVQTFENAEKAVSAFENGHEKPQLILSDVIMPGMSGVEMIKTMPADLLEGVAVLFMSGYYSQKMEETGLDTLVTGFIQKPFSQRKLLLQARALLEQARS